VSTISNFLAISGSLRAHSTNTEVLRACAILAPESVRIALLDGLGDLPHFNPDHCCQPREITGRAEPIGALTQPALDRVPARSQKLLR
jgi:NAD(P)H-dependent FMN reductase